MSRGRLRRAAIVVHRYVGLVLAVFLLTAGLTGALLAFYTELHVGLNPGLVGVTSDAGAKRLDPFLLLPARAG